MYFKIRIGVIFCVSVVQVLLTDQCLTPNNETAKCISLYSCPILISALASQQSTIVVEFIRRSNCGGTSENPLVCCGTSSNFIPNKNESVSKMSLLPTTRYCGLQHADDYLRTANDTSIRITEFPWSARIKFSSPDPNVVENKYRCIGSLINRRYVLTAAHCFVHKAYVPEAVQLGEYNTKNITDCVREPPFEEECSEPIQEFSVEKIVIHPNYHPIKKFHDIALIRLATEVAFSDYVRPICLPFPERTTAKVGDTLISTGWGKKNAAEDYVEIKKKNFSKLISLDECQKKAKDAYLEIAENQLCAFSFNNNTSFECVGDSGGPVMFSHRNQWHQEGIISYGIGCGPDRPAIYTNVKKYLDWILYVIER